MSERLCLCPGPRAMAICVQLHLSVRCDMSLSTLQMHRQTNKPFDFVTTSSATTAAAENTDLLVLKSKWIVDVVHIAV